MQALSDTLFYDGKCSLCAGEIKLLRRLQTSTLELIDVHAVHDTVIHELGTSKNQMLQVLHLRTADGRLMLGLDATAQAWSHTRIGWLFAILRLPLIKTIADKVYYRWAEKRACNLGYDSCQVPDTSAHNK